MGRQCAQCMGSATGSWPFFKREEGNRAETYEFSLNFGVSPAFRGTFSRSTLILWPAIEDMARTRITGVLRA